MELVAAATGYYDYNSMTRQPRHSSSPNGSSFMPEVLDGPDDSCREMFRMCMNMFSTISVAFSQTEACFMIDELLAIFLDIISHYERNRVIQERFH